ncbi:MAG TPA: hypothetical protein VGL53_01095, partial [Bryobacteraceae bacterium]
MTAKARATRSSVKIYIEGGSSEIEDVFRRAWVHFFQEAGLAGRMPSVVVGKGRRQTFDFFERAVKARHPDEIQLLLGACPRKNRVVLEIDGTTETEPFHNVSWRKGIALTNRIKTCCCHQA